MKHYFASSVHVLGVGIALDTVAAFVPVAPRTTPSYFGTMTTIALPPPRPIVHLSPTALHMSLFDRFFRVAKSNVNLILSNMEDPEKIMDQAVIDMQKDLVKVRQTYSEISAAQRRLQQQKDQLDEVASDWYNRAQLALQRNKDNLARQALTRRQIALDEASAVQQQIDVNGSALDKLYNSMHLLDQKILDAKSKKDQMAARARTAKTTMQVNDMLSGVTGKTSLDAFKRMEQKVEALEAAAEASAELGSLSESLPDVSLDREFLQLEALSAVDKELMQLKGMLHEAEEDRMKNLKVLQPSNVNNDDVRIEEEFQVMKLKSNEKIPIQWD